MKNTNVDFLIKPSVPGRPDEAFLVLQRLSLSETPTGSEPGKLMLDVLQKSGVVRLLDPANTENDEALASFSGTPNFLADIKQFTEISVMDATHNRAFPCTVRICSDLASRDNR